MSTACKSGSVVALNNHSYLLVKYAFVRYRYLDRFIPDYVKDRHDDTLVALVRMFHKNVKV